MKIRLTGTVLETATVAGLLDEWLSGYVGPTRFQVREISSFYPNRGDSRLGRVYLDVQVDLDGRSGDPR